MMKPTNLHLGLFPFDCHPDKPAMFNWPGSPTYVTDGRKIMGPYFDLPTADYKLTMVLVERRTKRAGRILTLVCALGIALMWLAIAFQK